MGCSQSKTGGPVAVGSGISHNNNHDDATEYTDIGGGRHDSTCLSPSVIALQTLTKRPNVADHVSKQGTQKVVREGAHHLRNVFAKPLELLKGASHSQLTVYPKTEEEKERLEEAMKKNFLFSELKHAQLFPLVQALEPCNADAAQIIINQGDAGDYFYVLSSGTVEFLVDNTLVGTAHSGDSFGELALMYEAPRAATVRAQTACQLYRVHQTTFRTILKKQAMEAEKEKQELLNKVAFLKDLVPAERAKLARVMRPRQFKQGEHLLTKQDKPTNFWIIKEGHVDKKDIADTGGKYEDVTLGAGDTLGEGALARQYSTIGYNATATSDGMAFCIDKETFEAVLGDLDHLVLKSMDRNRLAGIKIIADTQLDPPTLGSLANFMVERKFKKGAKLFNEGDVHEAALYIVRTGGFQITSKTTNKDEIIGPEGYFGEDQLLADVIRGSNGPYDPTTTRVRFTARAVEDDSTCGVLTLAVCRKCVDTTMLGKPHASILDSLVTREIPISELKRHTILGAGTFGQVWLVSRKTSKGEQRAYALKIQSKSELVDAGQARAVVNEKNIMAQLHSPFIINLVTTYKDEHFIYMLMALVQGGELYSIMHAAGREGMKEVPQTQFYGAGIAEALAYMHRRGFVYRDLKPENVLIDQEGYPVIVDFGFAKYVPQFTYTLCGTPLYLAPEVLNNRGHNHAADHWSFGVLMYEMSCGRTPFYKSGMDQTDLFKAIIRGRYHIPDKISTELSSLVRKLLVKDPALRLGSLRGGEGDIIRHPFFYNLDMDKLRRKEITAPHVPLVRNILDASNFEDWGHLEDKTQKKFKPVSRENEEIFEKF